MRLGLYYFTPSSGKLLSNIGYFYIRPYKHNLDYGILTVKGKFAADQNNIDVLKVLNKEINIKVENKSLYSCGNSYRKGVNNTPIDFEKRFELLGSQNEPDITGAIYFTIFDRRNDKVVKLIEPKWDTKIYNFFKRETTLKIGRII